MADFVGIPQILNNKIVDIDQCHISDDMFNIILNEFKTFAKNSDLPVYNLKSHEGVWRFLMIRRGVHTNEYMVNIVTSESVKSEIQDFCEDFVARYPQVTSIVNNLNRRKAQIAEGEFTIEHCNAVIGIVNAGLDKTILSAIEIE